MINTLHFSNSHDDQNFESSIDIKMMSVSTFLAVKSSNVRYITSFCLYRLSSHLYRLFSHLNELRSIVLVGSLLSLGTLGGGEKKRYILFIRLKEKAALTLYMTKSSLLHVPFFKGIFGSREVFIRR